MIPCQVCWRTMRWHNGQIRRSQNPLWEEVFQDCLTIWEESAEHSILARSVSLRQRPYTFAQTNLSSCFRLQFGGGPYIPKSRLLPEPE
jgi:hypothetical protein